MNGSLSLSECESITELVVNTEKVASLQGIEYFKNLQSLTCKPDFSSSSINPETGEWHLYNSADEEVVGLLTSLDVSNNPALQYLDCRGNQLTSLELWDQGSLTILNTSFNNLTWLDVSNSLALTELSCCSNPLTVLYMMTGQEIVNMDLPDITIIEYK